MYCVFKSLPFPRNKTVVPVGKKKFSTYEQARQWVRKHLRKTEALRNLFWTSNPMIGDYGYTIRHINPK